MHNRRATSNEGQERDQIVDAMRQELHGLQAEIRASKRGEPQRLLAGIAVALIVALAPAASLPILLVVSPLLLGTLVAYQINLSAEVAALAEYRDRIASVLNDTYGFPVFSERRIADLRRGSYGTLGAVAVIGTLSLGIVGWGLVVNASIGGAHLILQLMTSIVFVAAIIVTIRDFLVARVDTNRALDDLEYTEFRPVSAPESGASFMERLRGRRGESA